MTNEVAVGGVFVTSRVIKETVRIPGKRVVQRKFPFLLHLCEHDGCKGFRHLGNGKSMIRGGGFIFGRSHCTYPLEKHQAVTTRNSHCQGGETQKLAIDRKSVV